MAVSLKKRLADRRDDIIKYTEAHGHYEGLRYAGVKYLPSWEKWLEEETGNSNFGLSPPDRDTGAEAPVRGAQMASHQSTPEKSISRGAKKNKLVRASTEILSFENTALELVKPLEELKGLRGGGKNMWLRNHRGEIRDYYNANGRLATMVRFCICQEITLDNILAVDALVKEDKEKVKTIWDSLPGIPNNTKGGGRKMLKGSPVPPGWYVYKRGTIYDYIKPATEVSRLRGGPKMLWLRIHQEEVEDFYYQHGEEATLARFCLRGATLDSILAAGRHQPFVKKFTRVDRLELSMEAYRADVQDLRADLRAMSEQFSQFQSKVTEQLMKRLVAPLIQSAMASEEAPEPEQEIVIKPKHQCPPHHWKIGNDNIGRCIYCPATIDFGVLSEKANRQLARNTLQRG
jgi:hypothetical protein